MNSDKHESETGLPPGRWEDLFRQAGIQLEALEAAKSHRARATLLGNFLAQNLGREIPIEVNGRAGRARLCAGGGKRQRLYFFETVWDNDDAKSPGPERRRDGDGRPADIHVDRPRRSHKHRAGHVGVTTRSLSKKALSNGRARSGNDEDRS